MARNGPHWEWRFESAISRSTGLTRLGLGVRGSLALSHVAFKTPLPVNQAAKVGGGFEVHPWFRLRGKWTVRYTPATRFGSGTLSGRDTLWNDCLPKIEVNPDTCTVKAEGLELRGEPASVLPMAQQFFGLKTFNPRHMVVWLIRIRF